MATLCPLNEFCRGGRRERDVFKPLADGPALGYGLDKFDGSICTTSYRFICILVCKSLN